MVKLSEEMIVARTRVSDMENVKKLNCWGAELTDITVIRNLVNVEVLSLSVNCITTLADIQYCVNLTELYIRKNQIQDLNEICWLRSLTKLKNLWLEENPCAQGGEIYRMTVIKNLPQLQKLDNVMVQPDEVGEAMRRGVELIHPHDRPIPGQENLAYNYGPASYQTEPAANRGRLHEEEEHERRTIQGRDQHAAESYDHCPSRRVSNQVFDTPPCRRESAINPSAPDVYNQRDSPATDSLNQSGYGSRRGSQLATYPIDEGYVPEYHTGRRFSTQDQVPAGTSSRRSSRGVSQHSQDEQMRRSMSCVSQPEVPRYPPEESAYAPQPSEVNGRRASEATYNTASRYDRSNNETYTLESERNVVARHYEQTYDQVNHQIDSARQLVEIRKQSQDSPERPYPRRPKNRNSNILSAVLCLIKELDGPSLEVAEMAVRCRMEELED